MRIEDFSGFYVVDSESELKAVLSKRYNDGVNAFWLFHGAERYPAISILVRGDVSSLHYFPQDRHPGFRSVGNPSEAGLVEEGTTIFALSSTGEEQEIINESIVPFSKAVLAVKELLVSDELPTALEWFEL